MHLLHISPSEYQEKVQAFLELSEFLDLTPYDRHLAWREVTGDDDWHEWPVPINWFITDEYFIGTNTTVRPAIRSFLEEFWNPHAVHQLFVFIGGIGAGKSFSAAISMTYAIYQLSCMKKPQAYLSSFPGCQISDDTEIVLMNASAAGAEQGRKIVYGDIFEKVSKSPYFEEFFPPYPRKQSELDFPNRIRLTPGTSNWQSALGWNLYAFAIDEAAFGRETDRADYVKELFLALNQRRRSRFGTLGFGGMFTSPGAESGFVELLAGDASEWDTSTLVRRITTWDAKDELRRGARVFLVDRDPDHVRIVDENLLYIAPGVAQRPNGEIVRWKVEDADTPLTDDEVEAAIAEYESDRLKPVYPAAQATAAQ